MLLPKFDFDEPATVSEACQIMSELGVKAKVIAGGTDLMVNMKKKLLSPARLVSIARIPELKKIDCSDTMLKLGPCTTIASIAASAAIGKRWGAICAGAGALGSPLVRNRATVGGNLGTARPAADMPPSLMAYGARVALTRKSGQRMVSLDNFFRGPGLTEIAPDEIITEIQVDAPPPYSGASYINLGIRSSCDCNIVNVASYVALEGPGGPIKEARIVMGCVGPTHKRAPSAEKALIGQSPGEGLFAKAGEAAMADFTDQPAELHCFMPLFAEAGEAAMMDCTPIDDFRGSAEYKKDMVKALTRKTLIAACAQALRS